MPRPELRWTRRTLPPGGLGATSFYPAWEGNTGYQNAGAVLGGGPYAYASLADGTGLVPATNGSYSLYNFPGGMTVGAVTGVTFTGCRFTSNNTGGANVDVGGSACTFRYCTFEPSTVPPGSEPALSNTGYRIANASGYQYGVNQPSNGGRVTLSHCRFWGFANAVTMTNATSGTAMAIDRCLFQNGRADGGVDHTDGPGDLDQSTITGLVISNCTVVGQGNTNAIAMQGGVYNNIQITGNYLSGFGYMAFLGTVGYPAQSSNNTVFTGNTWGSDISRPSAPCTTATRCSQPGPTARTGTTGRATSCPRRRGRRGWQPGTTACTGGRSTPTRRTAARSSGTSRIT